MTTFLSDTEPHARKTYTCVLCETNIEKGVKYIDRRLMDSVNGPYTLRMHQDCEKITHGWSNHDWEYGWDLKQFPRHNVRKEIREFEKNLSSKMKQGEGISNPWELI